MTAPAVARPRPHVTLRGEDIPVVLPSRRDPRFKLSSVVITLHVLGQTLLGWKVSIAQILITMLLCGAVEFLITFRGQRIIAWPASGILTGSSVALILRASGTRHGDWWSVHGIQWFVLAGLISLLAKHHIRPTGKHLFNPSNIGIVWCLLVIGPNHVFAQYLWWGPNHVGQALAYAVIIGGAVWILRAVKMIPMAVSFLATFAVLTGAFALAGHSFIAIWHVGEIRGLEYWANLAISPEVLVFVFFMISDPQTAPKPALGRAIYGAGTAAVAAALIYFQTTEFGIKVSILSSLTVVCALVPFIEAWCRRRAPAPASGTLAPGPPAPAGAKRLIVALRRPAVIAALIVAVAAPIDTMALASNKQVVLIERGEVGKANAQ
jgi:Na+-translocating ferredoxin:NAD+ oxidoreductase RnfD subunit